MRENLPQVLDHLRVLWDAYGRLGYGGVNGTRAKKAIDAMEEALNEISRSAGIKFI